MVTVSKRRRKKPWERSGPPPNAAAPKVHVKIALANMDLRNAGRLVKPALLYADRVTVYSPAAWMMGAVAELVKLSDPRDQLLTTIAIVKDVPQLAGQLNVPPETLDQLGSFLTADRRLVQRLGVLHNAQDQLAALYEQLDALGPLWADQMPQAVARARESLGADELLVAVEAGAVKIADLGEATDDQLIADALRAATGSARAGSTDDMVSSFLARIRNSSASTGPFRCWMQHLLALSAL